MCARQPPSTIEAPLRLAWDGRHSEPSQPRSTASASSFREARITVPSSQRLTRRVTFTSRLPLDAIAGAIAGAIVGDLKVISGIMVAHLGIRYLTLVK